MRKLLAVFTFLLRHGTELIEYTATFDIDTSHDFHFKRIAGFFSDTLQVMIDSQQILLTRVSPLMCILGREESYAFFVDGQPVVLRWLWSVWGNPKYIILVSNNVLLAKYGSDKLIAKLHISTNPDNVVPVELSSIQLIREVKTTGECKELAREKYSLDNRAGSDILTVENEISKTLSNTLATETKHQSDGKLSVKVLSVVEAQISDHLSIQLGQAIGESITRKQNVKFSVKPGEYVVYTIVWRNQTRSGDYVFNINKKKMRFEYHAQFGLTFAIESRPAVI